MARFGIVTPCYNAARYIEANVASVRAQTVADWVQIVVDDGSTDGGPERVRPILASEPRLRLIEQSNHGVCRARNVGLAALAPDTEYVAFLDADDALEPGFLERLGDYLDRHPDVGLVHCGNRYIDGDGARIDEDHPIFMNLHRYRRKGLWGVEEVPSSEPETTFAQILAQAGIVPSLCLYRRSVLERTPRWDETFGQHLEDTDLTLQMAIRSRVHFVPEKLVLYRRHSGQHTADPARFGDQMRKLVAKWRDMPDLSDDQRAVVRDAIRFWEGRIQVFRGMRASQRLLAQGRALAALRFLAGALRRAGAVKLAREPLRRQH